MNYLLTTLLLLTFWNIGFGQTVWINEIHYDNSGTDINEGIEIAGPAGTDLSCYRLIEYNGNGGAEGGTTTLSGLIPDEGCGYGAIWFPISGLQNGDPDGIVLYNSCTSTVIQFLSYDGSFTATSGVANGMLSTDIIVGETGSTLGTESLQLAGAGTGYSDYSWQSPTSSSHGLLNSSQIISPCSGGNSITTGTVSNSPFSVDCSVPMSASGNVNFSSSGTFNAGNDYIVQLIDGGGAIIEIGSSLNDISNSGNISFTIPSGTPSGSYTIRIVSNDPIVVGSSSSSFTITQTGACQEPFMTSLLYDGCNSGSSPCPNEGTTEILFGNTGDYSIEVTTGNIQINYTTNGGYNLMETIVDESSTTSTINTALSNGGCPSTTFYDGYGQTLPPNTSFLLVNSAICLDVFDWDALCGSGPIYIIYGQNDPANSGDGWHESGNFGNTGGIKEFDLVFTTTSGLTNTESFDYTAPSGSTDGNYATWSGPGSPATQGNWPNCALSIAALSVEITAFKGEKINNENQIFWSTESERNCSHFELLKSDNTENFRTVKIVDGAGTTAEAQYYSVIDSEASKTAYYKLVQYDFDGKSTTYGPIIIRGEQEELVISPNPNNGTFDIISNHDFKDNNLTITDLFGNIVFKAVIENRETAMDLTFLRSGVYFIRIDNKIKRLVIN